MGLFSRKPKEQVTPAPYLFDPLTGCVVCKQAVGDTLHHRIRFYDAEYVARRTVVLEYLIHHDNCYSKEFLERTAPALTTMTDAIIVTEKLHKEYIKEYEREEKEKKKALKSAA
jgi:hypothetical protein